MEFSIPKVKFQGGSAMSQIGNNSALSSYATDQTYRSEQSKTSQTEKKTKVGGRTIGEPVLSEKAAKYYEKLRAKYSNMDFILVSPDKKAEAESKKGLYQSSKELLVLIDSDKIEKMAEDEEYREKYEGILSNATTQIGQMKDKLGANGERVSSVGMSFDDKGNASFFAVINKSLAAQKDRIEKKRAASLEAKKADAKKKAANEAKEKRAEAADKRKDPGKTGGAGETDATDKITVTASSWEELLKKIDDVILAERTNSVMTPSEKAVGGFINYSI